MIFKHIFGILLFISWANSNPSTCAPRISSSVDVTCTVDGKSVNCSTPLVQGTVVKSKCKQFYTQSRNEIPIATCSGGSWDNPLIKCVPDCGVVYPNDSGQNQKNNEFPWHVGLYKLEDEKYKYLCGGSIISPLIIITAAHCLKSDLRTESVPAQEFYVAAGKYYSDYNAAEDKLVQKTQVKEYHIPPQYKGYETNFVGDLAVVVLMKALEMNNIVRPVCVDWDNRIEPNQLKHNKIGRVAGWGFVDPNKPEISVELKQLNVPYIDLLQCLEVVPNSFRRFVTADKFCAGFTNGSSVCKGDAGGGLVFEWNENNEQKFYLHGLVSAGPAKNGVCDKFQYAVYTKISAYYEFIRNILFLNPVK